MQKLILGLSLILLTTFLSCKKDNSLTMDNDNDNVVFGTTNFLNSTSSLTCPEGAEIATDSLLVVVTNYVSTNHPNTPIDEVYLLGENGATNYGVVLENETQLLLDANGTLVSQGIENEINLSPADLPQSITDYLTTNYPSQTVESYEQKDWYGTSYLEVELNNGTNLIFDTNGNFLCLEIEDQSNHNDNHDDNSFANLPQIMQDYITTNYGTYNYDGADTFVGCTGDTIVEVKLKDAMGVHFYVALDLAATQVYTATEIATANLPVAISNSISTNYADYQIEGKPLVVTTAAGVTQYVVDLDKTTVPEDIDVWFNEDGTVICELIE